MVQVTEEKGQVVGFDLRHAEQPEERLKRVGGLVDVGAQLRQPLLG